MSLITRICSHELGLRFRHGDLQRVLTPGSHLKRPGSVDLIQNRLALKFEHALLEVLIQNPAVREHLEVLELSGHQRALVFQGGRFVLAVGPGLHAFWKQSQPLDLQVYDARDFRLEHEQQDQLLSSISALKQLRAIRAEEHQKALIYRNGELVCSFGPGTFLHWKDTGHVNAHIVDLRERVLEVTGQEIMTADKVTLRVNLLLSYRVVDALKSVQVVEDVAQALYREGQLALRVAMGGRSLEELLADKDAVSVEIRQALEKLGREVGVEIRTAGIRDLILPGDMKSILNQVIEAQKQAEANLIRRREETAAARSQANTARLMAENPILQRMKEWEQLSQVLAGTKTSIVLGQGDLTRQVRQMIVDQDETA